MNHLYIKVSKNSIEKEEYKINKCIYNYVTQLNHKLILVSSPLLGINAFGFSNFLIIEKTYYFIEDLGYFFEFLPYKIISFDFNNLTKFLIIDFKKNEIKLEEKLNLNEMNDKIFIFIGKNIITNRIGYYKVNLNINKGILIIPSNKRYRIFEDINDIIENYIEKLKPMEKSSLGNYCPIKCKELFNNPSELNPLMSCNYLYNLIYKNYEDILLEIVNCNYDSYKKFREWLNSRRNGK